MLGLSWGDRDFIWWPLEAYTECMPNLKHFLGKSLKSISSSLLLQISWCRSLDAQPCEERDTIDRGFGVQLLEKLTIGETSYWRNLLEKSGLLGCGLLSREVLPNVFGNMWVHLLIEDKCIQISGNLLSQEKVSQELQPIFWDNFKSKKQTHITVLSAQVILVHQKNKLLTQTCQISPNCLAIWSAVWSAVSPNCWAVWAKVQQFHQTAEQFGETADQTAEQFGGNCWAVWPNCWAVWGKLLSSLAKLLSSLGETAEQFGQTAEQFGQTAEQFGETADKTAEQFVSNCWYFFMVLFVLGQFSCSHGSNTCWFCWSK